MDLAQLDCLLQPLPVSEVMAANLKAFLAMDIIPALTTVLINGIFFLTLIKTNSLHTPSNFILLMLCFGDIMVGLIVQPIVITMSIYMLIGRDYSILNYALYVSCLICGGLSFIFAIIVSIDRYIAICHPFEYERLVTCKRYMWASAVATLIWSGYCVFVLVDWKCFMASFLVLAVLVIVALLVCYANIFLVIRKQRKFVSALESISKDEVSDLRKAKKEKRRVCTIGLIIGCFMFCYVPYIFWLGSYIVRNWNSCGMSQTEYLFGLWKEYCVFLCSLLNPIIYFLRSSEMRKAAWKVLKSCKRQ